MSAPTQRNETDANYLGLVNRRLGHKPGTSPVSISLFSGILGIEIGLEWAGFRCGLALDHDKDAKDVVEANRTELGRFPYLCADVNEVGPEQVLEAAGLQPGETALLAGGPPCQPFSKSGLRQGVLDDRGSLFKRYLEYLHVIRPSAFLLENVRGLFSSRRGEDFRLILEHFDDSGYSVYWKILDAAAYGVPQFRQRLFLVGFRDRIRFTWPVATHDDPRPGMMFSDTKPFVTAAEAISDLSELPAPRLTGRYAGLLEEIPEGLNYSYYTAERGHANPLFGWRSKFWYFLLKLARDRPSLTIQAYPGNNTGPFHWNNRRLGIEELLRLQSFPDWFTVTKPYMVAHRLIGNAVPPLLAEVLGRAILTALEQRLPVSRLDYLAIRSSSSRQNGSVRSGRGSGKGRMSIEPEDIPD